MLDSGGSKIAEKLTDVFVGERANRFDFNNDSLIDEEVGEEAPQQSAVLVEDVEGVLLNGNVVLFRQAMSESIFIYFFDVAVAKMAMERECGFADLVTELEYRIFHDGRSLGCFCPFRKHHETPKLGSIIRHN